MKHLLNLLNSMYSGSVVSFGTLNLVKEYRQRFVGLVSREVLFNECVDALLFRHVHIVRAELVGSVVQGFYVGFHFTQ